MQVKDFKNPQTLIDLNAEVSKQTEGYIPSILSELDPEAAMVLLNAVYLKGKWEKQFNAEYTNRSAKFNANYAGNNAAVQMMFQEDDFNYLNDKQQHVQLVELGYQGPTYQNKARFSMFVLLPSTQASFNDLRTHITVDQLEGWIGRMKKKSELNVYLPKFITEQEYSLKESLVQLGMEKAFDRNADFGGMSESNLFISRVIHKTYLEVDEEGTKAAAATAVEMCFESCSAPTVFKADRPFLFFIRDNQTQGILFQGVIQHPEYPANRT